MDCPALADDCCRANQHVYASVDETAWDLRVHNLRPTGRLRHPGGTSNAGRVVSDIGTLAANRPPDRLA